MNELWEVSGKSLRDPEVEHLLSQWHRCMESRAGGADLHCLEAEPWDAGILKRCRRLEEVMLTPVYYKQVAELGRRGIEVRAQLERERLAILLGVLVWVRGDDPEGSFSRQLARRRPGSHQGRLNGIRFQRLLRSESAGTFYRELRDAVRLLDTPLHIRDLVRDITRWEPGIVCPVRYRWAEEYYRWLPEEN